MLSLHAYILPIGKMKKVVAVFLFILNVCLVGAQTDDTLQKFYYQDGTLSSEGYMRNGKPDGYWKSYYPSGVLRSEGNRKDMLLDSVWKFYDEQGNIQSEITYRNSRYEGITRIYTTSYIEEITYKQDTIIGNVYRKDSAGHVLAVIPYVNGKEHGWARMTDTLGNIHTVWHYEEGNVIKREYINRYNASGQKNGPWKQFSSQGILLAEGTYLNGKKNGYFKYYDANGNFQYIEKYENDILIENATETMHLDRKVDYHPNGKIHTVAHYFKGVPEGVRREYDSTGKVIKSYIFHNGIRLGEGVVDDNGKKQGMWKEFYPSGMLKAKGKYINSKPAGQWHYYYEDGRTEIEGSYTSKGKKDGQWWWYYPSGEVLAMEEYDDGDLQGLSFSLSAEGDTLECGKYEAGQETGKWYYRNDSTFITGKYDNGNREGCWKTYYPGGRLKVEEHYFNGEYDGKVIYYWENAAKMAEYNYSSGLLNGNAIKYDENGNVLYITTYRMGVETQYDGVKVTPVIDISFE